MKLNPERLPQQLQRSLAPVYLVAGPELLLREEAVDAIRSAARKAGITARKVLRAERGFDWSDLTGSDVEMSLFAERSIIELRLPTGKPGVAGSKAIAAKLASLQQQDAGDLLLVVAEQWEFRSESTAWVKKLIDAGVYVPVWMIKSAQLPRWINARMRDHELQAEPDAVKLLAARVDGNLLAAAQEIDKLLLVNGTGTITLAQVERAVSDSSQFDAFKLNAAMLAGQPPLALRICARLQRQSIPQPMIVAAIERELLTLLQFQQLTQTMPPPQAFRQLHIWQSRQGLIEQAVRRIGKSGIETGVARLAELDRIAKGQQYGDFWVMLELLVNDLAINRKRQAA